MDTSNDWYNLPQNNSEPSIVNTIRERYNVQAEAEWERMEKDWAHKVSFEMHRRFLLRYTPKGSRVLEVGAGPGRYTFTLAENECRVVVTDLSPGQLAANKKRVSSSCASENIESWEILDLTTPTRFADDEFDVVLLFGGPLSYAFEHDEEAVKEMLRITKPSGVVLGSVMSLLGSHRALIKDVVNELPRIGVDGNNEIFQTGDMRDHGFTHECQLYTSETLSSLIKNAGGRVVSLCASNWASANDEEVMETLVKDSYAWQVFLDQEEQACRCPGAVDGGSHLLFAVQKN